MQEAQFFHFAIFYIVNSVESICFKGKRNLNLLSLTFEKVQTDFNYFLFNECMSG